MSKPNTVPAMRDWLVARGYIIGDRDPRLNTKYPGKFMVVEGDFEEHELPTEDGSNGPWCIVGDHLHGLIIDAFNVHFADDCLQMQLDGKFREQRLEDFLRRLLNCSELNMDDMEPETVALLDEIHKSGVLS
jgi:hypothetical protein